MKYSLLIPLLSLALTVTAGAVDFEEVFGENGAGEKGWQNLSQVGQARLKTLPSGVEALRVNNHVVGKNLPEAIKEDFVMEVEVLHGGDGAFLWFGLFDPLLEKGYVVSWQLPPTDQGDSKGRFAIQKVEVPSGQKPQILLKNEDRTSQAQSLGDEARSPRPALEEPAAKLKLTWKKASGELVLECEGEEIAKASDSTLSEFDSVLLSGNKDTLYRSIKVTGK